jgi:hypothetical protein
LRCHVNQQASAVQRRGFSVRALETLGALTRAQRKFFFPMREYAGRTAAWEPATTREDLELRVEKQRAASGGEQYLRSRPGRRTVR